jgi:hypothetical protein
MDINAVGLVILGIVVRLGIPAGATVLLVRWLSRLDARWQTEARQPDTVRARNTGCWDVNHCTSEQKAKCPAYARKEIPCWQAFRQSNGVLRENCIGCNVFKEAPLPVRA